VTASGADDQNVEETMAWAAPIRVIALTRIPPELTEDLGTIDLSDQQFRQIASSIERLVIDVFDGEGFMVWERKAE
jgi:hypothetical protein